jgi:cytochrome c oxidase subunit 2
MSSPLDPPEGNWWNRNVNRRESIWLGLSGIWSVLIFGWMTAYTRIGDQNPIGETRRVTNAEFDDVMSAYQDAATETDDGVLVPDGEDVYIQGLQWAWRGTPVRIETGTEYDIHLHSRDVQHGFSIRPEHAVSKNMNLQVLPGYEWVLPMEFDEPGTYHIICNEFCGVGHRSMHGTIEVVNSL